MHSLMELAMEVDEDVTSCASKDKIIQILLASEKALLPGGATGDDTLVEEDARSPLPSGKGAGPAVVAPIPGPPVGSASTDRAVLMAVYHETNGPPEKKARPWAAAKGAWQKRKGWGKSSPLGNWDRVTVDRLGRVTTLELQFNNLKGPIPSALGGLTALQTLHVHNNQLSGVIPPELGWLTALTDLELQTNKLTGPIPPELGKLTALRKLDVSGNNLSGSIQRELSQLTHLFSTWFIGSYFDGSLDAQGTSPNSTQLEGGIIFIRNTRSYVGQAAMPSYGPTGVVEKLLMLNT
ncbi:Hypothetical leucine rich repeat protein [Ectocarpus siliculosus]|uniref:Hypothetical leucine rich repeat protein n=1 Tax=Ectocarpus siliculosus TaxID=2880 RepID=D8LN56_ECTSI|nr:Hypothetical leucine rich repeat protein [Ectocarpus siliculosus]|eukprot:CBN74819.1 Hypothetical leucine rich repeat protein [Ectocarpus siliculosus]